MFVEGIPSNIGAILIMMANEGSLGIPIYINLQAECCPVYHATPRLASAAGQFQLTLRISLAAIMQGPIGRIRQAVSPVWEFPFTVEDDERDQGRPSMFVRYLHLNSIAFVELWGILHGSRVSFDEKTTGVKLRRLTCPLMSLPRNCDL